MVQSFGSNQAASGGQITARAVSARAVGAVGAVGSGMALQVAQLLGFLCLDSDVPGPFLGKLILGLLGTPGPFLFGKPILLGMLVHF